MIVDSSAVLAIMLREPGHESLVRKLAGGGPAGIGAPTLAETGVVLSARIGRRARALLGRFLQESGLTVVPFADEHWPVALEAFTRFGKGRHPAALNFGDCLTYATARQAGEPLLCVGGDFAKTDLELA